MKSLFFLFSISFVGGKRRRRGFDKFKKAEKTKSWDCNWIESSLSVEKQCKVDKTYCLESIVSRHNSATHLQTIPEWKDIYTIVKPVFDEVEKNKKIKNKVEEEKKKKERIAAENECKLFSTIRFDWITRLKNEFKCQSDLPKLEEFQRSSIGENAKLLGENARRWWPCSRIKLHATIPYQEQNKCWDHVKSSFHDFNYGHQRNKVWRAAYNMANKEGGDKVNDDVCNNWFLLRKTTLDKVFEKKRCIDYCDQQNCNFDTGRINNWIDIFKKKYVEEKNGNLKFKGVVVKKRYWSKDRTDNKATNDDYDDGIEACYGMEEKQLEDKLTIEYEVGSGKKKRKSCVSGVFKRHADMKTKLLDCKDCNKRDEDLYTPWRIARLSWEWNNRDHERLCGVWMQKRKEMLDTVFKKATYVQNTNMGLKEEKHCEKSPDFNLPKENIRFENEVKKYYSCQAITKELAITQILASQNRARSESTPETPETPNDLKLGIRCVNSVKNTFRTQRKYLIDKKYWRAAHLWNPQTPAARVACLGWMDAKITIFHKYKGSKKCVPQQDQKLVPITE